MTTSRLASRAFGATPGMRRRAGRARRTAAWTAAVGGALLGVLVVGLGVVNTPARAEMSREEAVREYLRLKSQKESTTGYRTPPIYSDSIGDSALSRRVSSVGAGGASAGTSHDRSPRALEPFGYGVFDSPISEFLVPPQAPVPTDYTLGPGDVVLLNLWGSIEDTYELTIDREGSVFVPKAGEVPLWGATLDRAGERLHESLSRIYSEFEMSLTLGRIRTIKVYVFGAVKRPGAYTVSGLGTLFNVLYLSGGPSEKGSLRNVQLTRGGAHSRTIDLYDVLLRGRNLDTRLADNDVVFVPIVGSSAAIRGRVRRPAVYELKGGETMLDLIELAGGLEADAYTEDVLVNRIVDRTRHVVLNVSLKQGGGAEPISNGDTVVVRAVYDAAEGFVEVSGHLKYNGRLAFRRGMRVSDAVRGRMKVDTYLDRANLTRTLPDLTKRLIAVDLRAVLAGDSIADVPLIERDVLTAYSVSDIERKRRVSIEGEIRREGNFELTQGMRVSDLVFLSGGLKKGAFLLYAEVARAGETGYSDIVRVDLQRCLDSPGGDSDLVLREDDKVFVREIPEWSLDDMVTISGEVRFPGRYALRDKNETLLQLLERAGGLTDRAFPRGAVFERSSIANDIQQRNIFGIMENLQEVTADSAATEVQRRQIESLRRSELTRIIIDMDALVRGGDLAKDIVLRGGDRLYLPALPSGVHVIGAVASSGTIKFSPKKDYRYYVRKAGGVVKSADRGQIRVVKPDGRVINGRLRRVDIELGDSIVVPKKISKDRDWWKILTNSFTIVSSAITTAYLIVKL